MRRFLLLVVATVTASTLLFVPGAVAGEPDTDEHETDEHKTEDQEEKDVEEKDVEKKERDRLAKPHIKCDGSFTFGSTAKITCEWKSVHPDAASFRVVRRGGGERKVFRGDDIESTTLADKDVTYGTLVDKDVEYGTRYRYRVVVLDEGGKRLQRSHWTKARKVRGRVQRLPLACEVQHAEEADESTEGEIAEGSEEGGEEGLPDEQLDGVAVVCEWGKLSRDGAVKFELWRKIKGERKERVTYLELDQHHHVDHLPAGTTKVKYVVRAVNEDGRRVGHSKIEWVHVPDVEPLPADER